MSSELTLPLNVEKPKPHSETEREKRGYNQLAANRKTCMIALQEADAKTHSDGTPISEADLKFRKLRILSMYALSLDSVLPIPDVDDYWERLRTKLGETK